MGRGEATVYTIAVVDGVGSVEKTIEALPAPEKLTIEDRDSVANAKAMYEALEQADRETVSETLREKLTGATERMAVLEKIDNAREQIRKLPEAADARYSDVSAITEALGVIQGTER